MQRELRGSTVVVTGASSGIGRAAARAFAGRGANVVVAARRADALEHVVHECELAGAQAFAVPTDVSDDEAVERLAARAVDRFGGIDTWVNNAGVYAVGAFLDLPPDVVRRVLDVNFFGVVNGCRAALPRLRERGAGVIVNVASVDGHVPAPYVAAYVASKWAVRGFVESLRQELRGEDVHVALVSPASIDTPLFQHAANFSGRSLKALTPTYTPEQVADAIVRLAERPRREAIVGAAGRLAAAGRRVSPTLADRAFAVQASFDQFARNGTVRATAGNLFEPMAEGTDVTGGWRTVYPRTRRRMLVAGATALAGAGVVARRRRG